MAWLNYTGIWSGFEPARWFGMGPVSKRKRSWPQLKLIFLLRGSNLLRAIQRFQFEDCSAMVAGDPESRPCSRAVDERPANRRFSWEQIFDHLAADWIKPNNVVAGDP